MCNVLFFIICTHILTVHYQVVAEPAWRGHGLVPHQTVQLLAVHASQGVQGEKRGDRPVVRGTVGGLTVQVRVPGEAGGRSGYGATGGGLPVGLTLHQDHRLDGGDRNGWREVE